jgi:glycosyltransferase involved in cell wall biosynthesis
LPRPHDDLSLRRPGDRLNTGGLPDIVEHQRTCYLTKTFDTKDLAHGNPWVPAQRETRELGKQARERIEAQFSAGVVAEQYRAV